MKANLMSVAENLILISNNELAVYLIHIKNVRVCWASIATDGTRYYAFDDCEEVRALIKAYDNHNAYVDLKNFQECYDQNEAELESHYGL